VDAAVPFLGRLVTKTLSSVIFVGDYVQFDFNGPRLSAFVWPQVDAAGQTSRFGDPGYRDALVSLISRDVTEVEDSPTHGLVLMFGGDAALMINPELDDLQGPEIAMLQMNDDEGAWEIWRPGEGSFTDRDW